VEQGAGDIKHFFVFINNGRKEVKVIAEKSYKNKWNDYTKKEDL
jgi:hypothetical protein